VHANSESVHACSQAPKVRGPTSTSRLDALVDAVSYCMSSSCVIALLFLFVVSPAARGTRRGSPLATPRSPPHHCPHSGAGTHDLRTASHAVGAHVRHYRGHSCILLGDDLVSGHICFAFYFNHLRLVNSSCRTGTSHADKYAPCRAPQTSFLLSLLFHSSSLPAWCQPPIKMGVRTLKTH
jgi:hypothetical protein